jgi:hypothetical protein
MQTNEDIETDLNKISTVLQNPAVNRCIIGAGSNAKSALWNSNSNDERGTKLPGERNILA